jgi:hypothetical protein
LRRDSLSTEAETLTATVDLQEDEHGLKIAFDRCFAAHVGLRVRGEESPRHLKRAFAACSRDWDDTGLELTVSADQATSARLAIPRLAKTLAEIAFRPLAPRFLVAALNITTRERLRWTKDGRLPTSDAVLINRAQVIAIPTYAVSLVEELSARPDILAAWREQDALEARAGRGADEGGISADEASGIPKS